MKPEKTSLVPIWIRFFSWIFIVFSAAVPIVIILSMLGFHPEISLYGLETNSPLTIKGATIMILFFVKGVVGYGLLKNKTWALNIGIGDAIVGLVICAYVMIINPSFRLEVIFLVPYLISLFQINRTLPDKVS